MGIGNFEVSINVGSLDTNVGSRVLYDACMQEIDIIMVYMHAASKDNCVAITRNGLAINFCHKSTAKQHNIFQNYTVNGILFLRWLEKACSL